MAFRDVVPLRHQYGFRTKANRSSAIYKNRVWDSSQQCRRRTTAEPTSNQKIMVRAGKSNWPGIGRRPFIARKIRIFRRPQCFVRGVIDSLPSWINPFEKKPRPALLPAQGAEAGTEAVSGGGFNPHPV